MLPCLTVLAQSALCMQWSHGFCVKDEREPEGGGAVLKTAIR